MNKDKVTYIEQLMKNIIQELKKPMPSQIWACKSDFRKTKFNRLRIELAQALIDINKEIDE